VRRERQHARTPEPTGGIEREHLGLRGARPHVDRLSDIRAERAADGMQLVPSPRQRVEAPQLVQDIRAPRDDHRPASPRAAASENRISESDERLDVRCPGPGDLTERT
jgi:hypothetical protein